MPKKIDIEELNKRLKQAGQQLRIDSADAVLRLSNGLELTTDDRRVFLRRVRNSKHNLWLKRIDRIYNGAPDEAENALREVKSMLSSQAAKRNWEENRERLIECWKGRKPHNKGEKMPEKLLKRMREIWQSPEHRAKCSEAKQGRKNPMFGKKHSAKNRTAWSQGMKRKILHGEFTPNSNNRNTHWNAEYRGQRYRSSWEALYHSWDPDALYEQVRIPYPYEGKEYIYIVDFVNHSKRQLVEVKPRELIDEPKMRAKMAAAQEWANSRGYKFVIADREYLISLPFPVLEDFDLKTQEKIRKLYEIS